jgi:CheY-like chemotaxis protein
MSVQPPIAPPGVLVADDNEHVRAVLGVTLREMGLTPFLAADGREAVELFGRHRDQVRAVLLDVRMPGLDGPRTLAELRRIVPHVPCCFMTGNSGHYGGGDLLALGAARVFEKPFRLEEVIETLRVLCGRPR